MKKKLTEEEFLKNHPSLKGKIFNTSEFDVNDLCNNGGMTTVDLKDIHETQLDKQKVKEVIDDGTGNGKHYPRYSEENPYSYCMRVKLNERARIKKELGLR